jgi:hypothetical protein
MILTTKQMLSKMEVKDILIDQQRDEILALHKRIERIGDNEKVLNVKIKEHLATVTWQQKKIDKLLSDGVYKKVWAK